MIKVRKEGREGESRKELKIMINQKLRQAYLYGKLSSHIIKLAREGETEGKLWSKLRR